MNQPSQVQTLFQQARQAYARGDHASCLAACQRLIRMIGRREEVLNLLAMSLLAQDQALRAAAEIREALKQNPRSTGMLLNAARIDLVLADRRSAKRHAMEAARLASGDARVLYQAALLCRQCGDYPQALRLVDRCQARATDAAPNATPDLAEAWYLKGSMLLDQGDTEAAEAQFEQALRIDPQNARALADLGRLRVKPADDEAAGGAVRSTDDPLVRRLVQVARHGRNDWDRSAALFCLADIHHRAEDYDAAGKLYRDANAVGTRVRPFDLAAWERKQADTLERYGKLQPAGEPGTGAGANLVFLVGMPRSGTSLCEQILGAHSGVLAGGELQAMQAIELHSPPDAAPEDRRRRYLAALPPDTGRGGVRLVTDKLPMNFERVGMIHELFPGARFIHCRRHPLDTIWSCFQQDFQAGVTWAFDLDRIARVYLAQHRLMTHWAERLPAHVHAVDYETLVTDLEAETNAVAGFLGLDVEPAMLEPHRSDRTVQTASRLQVRQSVYTSSVGKWRAYADALKGVAAYLEAEGIPVREDSHAA